MASTSESVTSESTLKEPVEERTFEQVVGSIATGAKDALVNRDFLSYSTLLDIFLQDPTKYTVEERESLLACVLKTLSENSELTYEIGWDLPSLIIAYVDSDYDFSSGIRNAPCVYKVLKIFEVLAKEGNPKELFLKGCELLETLHVNVDNADDAKYVRLHQENFFDIKLYCVLELIDANVKKIHTLYPSRFLAMAIGSFVNLVYLLNNTEGNTLGNNHFVLQRAYTFVRNYTGSPEPREVSEYTKEELDKIRSDEAYLQRKMLTGFTTNIINMCTKQHPEGFALDYFCQLQRRANKRVIYEFEYSTAILDRWVELAYSFDISLKTKFDQFVSDSRKLIDSVDLSQEDAGEVLFEKCVVDYQENMYTNIVNSSAKTINDSTLGELILFTNSAVSKQKLQPRKHKSEQGKVTTMSFKDAICMALRLVVPQMVQPVFSQKTIQDLVLYWTWVVVSSPHNSQCQDLRRQVREIPERLISIFYQLLLFAMVENKDRPTAGYMVLTALTKLLFLSPEPVGFAFIRDSLENCPYQNVKAPLIGIYKELLLNSRSGTTEELDLGKASLKANVNGGEKQEKGAPPPLPPRQSSLSTDDSYSLRQENLNDILELMLITSSDTLMKNNDNDDIVMINSGSLSTLAAYLNFFVALKRDPMVVANKAKIEKLLKSIEDDLDDIKQHSENQFEKNAAGMLQLTIDRFRD
ncbi:uncharacterized protein LODBEIA_P14800 [Lodderomyces beijingensis]|uniref:YAP1 binding protein 2 n=1 Tax=Lodderomyces beijingensis TaxID=1775926 RepID=A0ABP0ZGF8_9ASCO